MTNTRPQAISETKVERSERYGVTDYTKAHGHREVGSLIRTYEVKHKIITDKYVSYRNIPADHIYALWVSATRDNTLYAGVQETRYFPSIKEREIAINKYIQAARRRAIKKFG